MHDFGWLIFGFHSELEMLETLSASPYFVFGWPLILKIMPEFFDFQANDMTKLPTWVKLPNLPLRCWTPLCLSKLARMIGKPIHCDIPTANMSRLSYARILVEVDLLYELPQAIQVVLPNGMPFSQQVTYESLPRFCTRCRVISHSANVCNRGPSPMKKKRPHIASVSGVPFEDATVVEQQQPDSADPPTDPPAPTAANDTVAHMKAHSPELKRSKVDVSTKQSSTLDPMCTAEEGATPAVKSTRRQYLTRSKVAATFDATPLEKQKLKGLAIVLMSMSSSDITAPLSTF